MPKIPSKVQRRLAAGVRKYQKILAVARDRDINESDTVVILTDFLHEVLGFDKYTEITTEFAIRSTYCDLAVKIEGQVEYLLEAKAIGMSLHERHLRQAINYAANQGIQWVVLTNGAIWHVYSLTFEKPIRHNLVFTLDLLGGPARDGELIERLFLLSKEGFRKSAIDTFQQKKDACSPFLIGAVILSDPLIGTIRRELRRISPGAKITEEEVRAVIKEDVLKRDVVEGDAARSAEGRAKRAANRNHRKKREADGAKTSTPTGDSQKSEATELPRPHNQSSQNLNPA